MAYITLSNSKRLLRSIDLKQFEKIAGQVYKKDIYFLNSRERAILIGIRELLKNPEYFAIEYYKPIDIADSLRFVFEEQKPAYHIDNKCLRLQSNFKNFEIPSEIREKGPDKVIEFRDWFKDNMNLLDTPDVFVMRLHTKWGIVTNPKAIDYSNSGAEDYSNLNLQELEIKIDEILRASEIYYWNNPEKRLLIREFSKLTFLGYRYGNILKNNTGLNDTDLKDFLKEYDKTFKQPIKDLLIQYYRVLFNFEMKFEGSLLEALNFRRCGSCHKNNEIQEISPPEIAEEDCIFPF